MERLATIERMTAETKIAVTWQLDGKGSSQIGTGIGFFDHMLVLLAKHGLFDLAVKADGDLFVDGHHTVEDTGIVLGQALTAALGNKEGIRRYGSAWVPMDEALVLAVVDISGRPYLAWEAPAMQGMIGAYDSQLTEEFLRALCVHGGLTLHVRVMAGKNLHHIVEAVFKAVARALAEAVRQDARIQGVMSSKGSL